MLSARATGRADCYFCARQEQRARDSDKWTLERMKTPVRFRNEMNALAKNKLRYKVQQKAR